MKFSSKALFLSSILCGLCACSDKFSQASLVDRPRLLAITTDPADALPGERVTVRAWIGGFSVAPTLRWTVCTRPEETNAAIPLSSFGQFTNDVGCASVGAAGVRVVSENNTEFVFEVPPTVLNDEALLRAAFGASLPRTTLDTIVDAVGLPLVFTVEARLPTDGETPTLRAFKRLIVRRAEPRNHNPPLLPFTFAGQTWAPIDAFRCGPSIAGPVTMGLKEKTSLAPNLDESWIELFDFVDAQGQHTVQTEAPLYSVFSTAGVWDLGRARLPDREPVWTSPETAMTVTHWFVIRDGRGGTAACTFQTEVR